MLRAIVSPVLFGLVLACSGKKSPPSLPAQVSATAPSDAASLLPQYSLSSEQQEVTQDGEDGQELTFNAAAVAFDFVEAPDTLINGIKLSQPLLATTSGGDAVEVSDAMGENAYALRDIHGYVYPERYSRSVYYVLHALNEQDIREYERIEGAIDLRIASDVQELLVPLAVENLHTHAGGMLPMKTTEVTNEAGATFGYRWLLWSNPPCPEGTRIDQGVCIEDEALEGLDPVRQYSFEAHMPKEPAYVLDTIELVDMNGDVILEADPDMMGSNQIRFYGDPAEDPFSDVQVRLRYFSMLSEVSLPVSEDSVRVMFHDGLDEAPAPAPSFVEPVHGQSVIVVYLTIWDDDGDAAMQPYQALIEQHNWPVGIGDIGCTYPSNPGALVGFSADMDMPMAATLMFETQANAAAFVEESLTPLGLSIAGISDATAHCLD